MSSEIEGRLHSPWHLRPRHQRLPSSPRGPSHPGPSLRSRDLARLERTPQGSFDRLPVHNRVPITSGGVLPSSVDVRGWSIDRWWERSGTRAEASPLRTSGGRPCLNAMRGCLARRFPALAGGDRREVCGALRSVGFSSHKGGSLDLPCLTDVARLRSHPDPFRRLRRLMRLEGRRIRPPVTPAR
jgi:hypothetical protein